MQVCLQRLCAPRAVPDSADHAHWPHFVPTALAQANGPSTQSGGAKNGPSVAYAETNGALLTVFWTSIYATMRRRQGALKSRDSDLTRALHGCNALCYVLSGGSVIRRFECRRDVC